MTRALLALLLAAALAACGAGGGDGTEVASLGTQDTATDGDGGEVEDGGAGDGEVTDAEREDALLEFTECMRDHGVDLPDPEISSSGDGGGRVVVGGPGGGGGPQDQKAFEEADEECRHIMEDVFGDAPEMDPEEQAEMQDNALAYAQCMRDHGIEVPDPEFSDGGIGMRLGEGIDPEDPDFIAAEEACQPELGFEDGDGPTRTKTAGSGSATVGGS